MIRPPVFAAAVAAVLVLLSCKQQMNPHVPAEQSPDFMVAEIQSASVQAGGTLPPADKRTRITLNNAPDPGQPLEQELVQHQVEVFEKQHPDIRIEFSTWQFTPETFIERAKNRTLTDIVEVSAAQMPAIVELNYATDITENLAAAPFLQKLNPEALSLFAKGDRVYGLPTELHTVALFYNKSLVNAVLNPPKPEQKSSGKGKEKKTSDKGETSVSKEKETQDNDKNTTAEEEKPKKKKSRKQSKGDDVDPRDFSDMEDTPNKIDVAQFWKRNRSQYYQQEEDQTSQDKRGEQEVQDYFNVAPQQTQQRGKTYYQNQPQQQQGSNQQQYYKQQQQQQQQSGSMYDYQQQQQNVDPYYQPTPQPKKTKSKSSQSTRTSTRKEPLDEDILTTEAEAQLDVTTETAAAEKVTTVVETAGLPDNWESFIKLAVQLTDHERGVYGYAPVLFAQSGGREFSQWSIQTGLKIQIPSQNFAELDIAGNQGGEVAQFLKDLRWRYDVMPPVEKCYADNLVHMFASGKLAMMMLPATRETIAALLKLGMPIDDIGIAALPAGPANRKHLTFGKGLIINTQLDKDKRAAAFKWLLFQMDPETKRLREQFYFREQDLVGGPEAPIYNDQVHLQYVDSLKQLRNLPVFAGYERVIASNLQLEPPFFTERLYEAIAEGVRPIVEQQDSRPMEAIRMVAGDFKDKYLREPRMRHTGAQRYLDMLKGNKAETSEKGN